MQVLHTGRMRSREAKHPRAEQLLQRLRANNLLYVSPVGSNDDWYWIYAAAQAGTGPAQTLSSRSAIWQCSCCLQDPMLAVALPLPEVACML